MQHPQRNLKILLLSALLAQSTAALAQEGGGALGTPGVPPTPQGEQTDADQPPQPQPPQQSPQQPQGEIVEADQVVIDPTTIPAPTFRGSQMTVGINVYELGCNAGMHFVYQTNIYVQCANAVVKVELATGRVLRAAVNGMPTSFFERGGRVWVELNHSQAYPVEALGSAQAAPAPAPTYPQQAPRPSPVDPELMMIGEVTAFDSGEAVVRFPNGMMPSSFRNLNVVIAAEGRDPVVGAIVRQTQGEFIVRVAYDQYVDVGAEARFTDAPTTGSTTLPERRSSFRIHLGLRALIGAGDDGGGGIVADADLEWRLRAPIFFRLLLEPMGAGFGDDPIALMGGHFLMGYDSKFLAMGAGIGAQLVETYDSFDFVDRKGIGTSIGLMLRIGSPEGFYVELFNAMTYVSKFQFGSMRVRAQWPIGHRSWMVIRGAGGITRIGYGEVGFRRLIGGWSNGRPLFMTATFGGAGIFSQVDGYNAYAGPTFGVSFEAVL